MWRVIAGAMPHTLINTARWAELPLVYQPLIKTACQAANSGMQSKDDARNPASLPSWTSPEDR